MLVPPTDIDITGDMSREHKADSTQAHCSALAESMPMADAILRH
eukprot:COSAG06_NODE_19509_length_835_cov_0.774457_1_plen_43_part_10